MALQLQVSVRTTCVSSPSPPSPPLWAANRSVVPSSKAVSRSLLGSEKWREKIGAKKGGCVRVRSSLDTAGPVVAVGQVTEVTKDTFWPLVKAAGDKTVVVDMYTQWCGPCKVMAPKFKDLSKKYLDVVFLKLDCNQDNKPLAKELGIRVVPTFKILKDSAVVKEVTGAKFDDLVAAIETIRLYFTKIGIGTPPKDYYVQVDTGSDIMWVNCAGCVNCPTKTDLGVELRLYDPKGSTSGTVVTCNQQFCIETLNSTSCTVGSLCTYVVAYGDGSSSGGYFVSDTVQLDRASGNLQTTPMNGSIAFGCGTQQSGQLGTSSQALDGILGFGQANSSMIEQLASAGKVKKMFAHCLDGTNGGGIFAIGQLVQPKVNSTPLIPNQPHYTVMLKAVEVGGDILQLPANVLDPNAGTSMVVDSGTTLVYLADGLFNPLMKKIMDAQPGLKPQTVEQQFTCFQFTGNVDGGFPDVIFHFENSLSMTVYPHEYLFPIHNGVWCVGWQNGGMQSKDGNALNLLGDMVLSNKLVLYDLENQTLGWTDYNCSSTVTVKDEQSGAEYLLGPNDLSSSCNLNTGWALTPWLVLAILLNYWIS